MAWRGKRVGHKVPSAPPRATSAGQPSACRGRPSDIECLEAFAKYLNPDAPTMTMRSATARSRGRDRVCERSRVLVQRADHRLAEPANNARLKMGRHDPSSAEAIREAVGGESRLVPHHAIHRSEVDNASSPHRSVGRGPSEQFRLRSDSLSYRAAMGRLNAVRMKGHQ